jgi:HPt (histidine-containing phosphotransfer) domain-containing protein
MTAAALIDLDHLEKYVVGDVALRDEILSIFGDQVQLLNEQFSIDQSDEGWGDTAHSIKGAARGIGAWVLGDLCAEAETLTGKIPGKNEKRAALLVSLRQQLETTLGEAKRLRDPI